ncbi:hypothetical protein H2198_002141 [Neophaeococcomyces mojaviensis]|uniref:Uncharacterized protein n=1 Tax=Neophaeococcomyces mojaviensis TaxID=3383035 RepID=A0ACC3AFM9_9EURO|nr:hypothetical protein H2198_002141 [Knufia sp. JES_112]
MSSTRPEINIYPKNYSPSDLQSRIYDVVIIGGGPAGETTAAGVIRGGLSALLIESELAGGECPYWACVPSKALLRASEAISSANTVGGARQRLEALTAKYGEPPKPEVNLEGLWARRDMFAHDWTDDFQVKGMQSIGVDITHGFGRVCGTKKVVIRDWYSGGEVEIQAKYAVVVATGSAPIIPSIEGLGDSMYWTTREAVSAKEVPDHLIILGAGAVGTEMATLYNQLGSKVTLISNSVLPKLVPEVGKTIGESLAKAGVDVKLGLNMTKVSREGSKIRVSLSDKSLIEGTQLLIATGRRARTIGMTLDSIHAPAEGAWIEVDDSMCAKAVLDGWLYAVGDVNGQALMTHIAKYQAKIASRAIVARYKGTYDFELRAKEWDKLVAKPAGHAIAQSVFTDPQVATCGLTPAQAAIRGIKTRTISVQMSGPGTWLHADGYKGWAQWVVDEHDRLVGATFAGRDVVDLVHASTTAIVGRMTLNQMWHVTPPFPTMSEVYTALSEAAETA